jgi:hypothetical protein
MGENRKITVQLPGALLQRAQHATGKGITETIRQGLQLVSRRLAYQELRRMRGKVKFSIDLDQLRKDRR